MWLGELPIVEDTATPVVMGAVEDMGGVEDMGAVEVVITVGVDHTEEVAVTVVNTTRRRSLKIRPMITVTV